MEELKIESEDVFVYVKMWVTIHSIYLNGEFMGKSSDAVGKIEELNIDLNNVVVNDEHTKDVLGDVYRSAFIVSRYAS